MAQFRIGISGWTYTPWRGVFYPEDLTQKRELEYASRQVNSIEINGTFYSLQKASSFKAWADATPDDFIFSVKGPRFITHIRRLRDPETVLANFFASGVTRLGKKLGPIFWQLPPNFKYDEELLRTFFRHLPGNTKEAAALAKLHDDHLKAEAWTEVEADRPIRHAMEVRNASFETPAFIELLRENNIALVIADTAGKWPFMEDVTSDFVYVRLHGEEKRYESGYTDEALAHWETQMRAWSKGATPTDAKLVCAKKPKKEARDIFAYFDNDVKVHAPFDAMKLSYALNGGTPPRQDPGK